MPVPADDTPKSQYDTHPFHLAMSPGNPGGKEDGVCLLPEGRNVASAGILLGRASGYGQYGILTGPADVGINININSASKKWFPWKKVPFFKV